MIPYSPESCGSETLLMLALQLMSFSEKADDIIPQQNTEYPIIGRLRDGFIDDIEYVDIVLVQQLKGFFQRRLGMDWHQVFSQAGNGQQIDLIINFRLFHKYF